MKKPKIEAPHNISPLSLKKTAFPECAHLCSMIEYFGVCECESICSHKFDKEGNPKEKEVKT